jgi:hypothetical protein
MMRCNGLLAATTPRRPQSKKRKKLLRPLANNLRRGFFRACRLLSSIREGAGQNRGNTVYEFNVEKLEDLTDAKIDQILQALLETALGLKPGR